MLNYFFFKKNNEIYNLMKVNLNKNVDLLITYFNVMILSKAFKFDKNLLQPNKSEPKQSGDKMASPKKKSIVSHVLIESKNTSSSLDYEADAELSALEGFTNNHHHLNNTFSKYDLILFPRILELCLNHIMATKKEQKSEILLILKCASSNETSKDDQINRMKDFELKYSKINQTSESFMKKLLYLLESCSLNIHIMLNNVSFSYLTR